MNRIHYDRTFTIGDQVWIPILGKHGTFPTLGFRVGPLVYLTDLSGMDESERLKISGAQVLVVNALRKTPHSSHFSLDEAIEFAQSTKVPRVYLTHISHQMGLHEQVDAELPDGIHLAYDGLRLEV
jgi:phosphoribosyl 1,2-cyclic phosphate phosphodiesterase